MNVVTANVGSEPRYKLKIKQPKFYIHSHKKIVVCELHCAIPELPFQAKIHRKHSIASGVSYYCEFKVKASAKCRPGDEYNEETGMKIAESKAMIKAYDKARRILEDYKEIVGKEWDKASHSTDFFELVLGRECMHLESIVK